MQKVSLALMLVILSLFSVFALGDESKEEATTNSITTSDFNNVLDAYTDVRCTNNACDARIYGSPQYAKCSGVWQPIKDVFKADKEDEQIVVTYCGLTYKITPYLVLNDANTIFFESKSTQQGIQINTQLNKTSSSIAFTTKFENVPKDLKEAGWTISPQLPPELMIDDSDLATQFPFTTKSSSHISTLLPEHDGVLFLDPEIRLNISNQSVIEDAGIRSNEPSNNFGTDVTLPISGDSCSNKERIVYKFNLTSLGNINVSRATFHVTTSGCGGNLDPTMYNSSCISYNENTITWNNRTTQCPNLQDSLLTTLYYNCPDTTIFNLTTVFQKNTVSYTYFTDPGDCVEWNYYSSESGTSPPYILINLSYFDLGFSAINCTSCNLPLGDTTSPYSTEDASPTFRFLTSQPTKCRISDINTNYASMGQARDCEETDYSLSHVCTVAREDEIISPSQNVYIACNSSWGVLNSTSLLMNLQLIEHNRTTSLARGVESSVIGNGVILFNDQQVYLRNAAGSTKAEMVDYVAQYGNQRWILNYQNTTILGLFNLSPVVYVLEITGNKSYYEIEQQVSAYINSTKN
jgi:hypothetical protein